MSSSVRPRPSPGNSPRTSPCSSPRFSRRSNLAPRSPSVKRCIMPVLVVHGGAAKVPNNKITFKMNGVKRAVFKGYEVLMSPRGTALDAVEMAVRTMEDDPIFNAGYGASLNINGQVELDAMIMEGTKMRAGAVAGIHCVANPVTLAKRVMEQSDHVLMIGEGAENFARNLGFPLVPREQLITTWAKERLEEYQSFVNAVNSSMTIHDHDTVGAVAVDSMGHVACATSTGGITAKQIGRVGDSPIIGSGGYADDFSGAVSTTGHGEAIMRTCLSRNIAGLIQQGMSAQDSAVAGLEYMRNRVSGNGGAIVVTSAHGGAIASAPEVGIHFTTEHMPWCYRRGNMIHYGMRPNEDYTEEANTVEMSP